VTLVAPRPTPAPAVERAHARGRFDDLGFGLFLAGILLNCFAGHWASLGVHVPIDRGLLLAGLALEWRRARRGGRPVRPDTAAVLLAAFAVWTALSFIGSPVRDSDGVFFLVDLAVLPAILYAGAPLLFDSARRRFAFAAVFAVFGIYLGVTAITQTLQLPALVFPAYILDPSVGIHADRARGPYAEAVNNGIMLVFSGALGGVTAALARRTRWRVVGIAAVVLTAIGCTLTLTRAIWFAAAGALLVGFLLTPALRRRAPVALLGLAVAAGLFLVAFPGFGDAATARGGDESPIWDRLNVNAAAGRMLVQNPLLGVGWNQAGERMSEFVRLGGDYPVTAASATLIPHNVFLGRFAELGILGGSLWLAATIAALVVPVLRPSRPGFGPWRVALLACTVAWVVVANFGPVNYSQPAYLLALVAGVTASGAAVRRTGHDWRIVPRRTTGGVHRG
jgi:putative inorganic carbon (HCO3(-)) transporter